MATDFPRITVTIGFTFVSFPTFKPPENMIKGSEGDLQEHHANCSIAVN